MAERGIIARLRSWLSGPVGPINWTQNGGIPTGWSANFWQQNLHPYQGGESATVNACVNAYAQTIAQLQAGHWKKDGKGGQTQIFNTPLAKILRNPNGYQTRSDFFLNLVSDLLFRGNAYAWAERDDRGAPVALHLIPAAGTQVLIEFESRAVFYGLAENPLAGQLDYAIPQRDVLHIRCRTKPGEPLNGITPLRWAAMAQSTNTAITASQAAFFAQASQPSGFLSTDQPLTSEQMSTLREAWMNRATGVAAGQVPVLGGGLKFNQLTMTSQDAQLVEAFAMTVADIARAYGVPLPIIGDLSQATFNNVEQLIGFWLSTGLGFMVEHIEIAFDKFFGLPEGQFVELDTDTLLRTDFKNRIDGLTKAITGGLYSPNEARAKEGLTAAEDGDEPRVQAQVVPLSQVNAEPAAPADTPPGAPVAPDPANDDEPDDEEKAAALFAMITRGIGEVVAREFSAQAAILDEQRAADREALIAREAAMAAEVRELFAGIEQRAADERSEVDAILAAFAERAAALAERSDNSALAFGEALAAMAESSDADRAVLAEAIEQARREAEERAATLDERLAAAARAAEARAAAEQAEAASRAAAAENRAEASEAVLTRMIEAQQNTTRGLANDVMIIAEGLREELTIVTEEARQIRTMIEAADPALDPEEANELYLLQMRKAKKEAGHAP